MSFLWGNTSQQQPDPKKFANISNDQINSIQQAQPVKYLAGRNYVAGDFITPAYNPKAVPVKTQAGKGQSTTTGYKYFADFALLFCMGGRRPVDAVYKLIVDSDIRWDGEKDGGTGVQRQQRDSEIIHIDDLGDMRIYWGSDTQAIDTTLLSVRNATASKHDDKTTYHTNHRSGAVTATGGDPLDPQYPQTMDAGDPDPYSGHYDAHPAYRGQCYCVFKNWKLGRDRTSVPNIQLELARGCPAPWLPGGQTPKPPDNRGVNPIAVLYDWLTDPRFGMALPDSLLNLTTFSATYTVLESYIARISPLVTSQNDFRQAVAELLEYYDGWIRRNGTKIEVGVWKTGNILPVATLNDNDLLAEPELEPQGFGPTMNEITVVYKDKDHHFNDYTQVYRDPNNFRITGGPRPETYQRPWITDADLAKQYARTSGAAAALPFTQGDLTVKREWLTNNSILPGVVFRYLSAFYGLDFLMRLQEVEYEADTAASAKLSVVWERSKWPALYVPPGLQGPGGFILGPRALWQSRITEVPYLLADQKFDTQLITLAVRGNVEVQGYRTWISTNAPNFDIYNMVPDEASTSAFASFGKLAANIIAPPNQNTTVYINFFGIDQDEIVSMTHDEQNDDTLLLFVQGEVMSVGQVTPAGGGKFNVNLQRGRFGTTIASHPSGTVVFFLYRERMRLLDNAAFVPGTPIKVKLQPFTADLDYLLSDITPIDYTVIGFQDLPAPTLTPSPGTFVNNVVVTIGNIPGGCTPRYTRDGTPVRSTSPVFAPLHHAITLTATTTLRMRFYATTGQTSPEVIGTYTRIPAGPGQPNPQCGAPSWSFDGTLSHTQGNMTLSPTTPGSTIKYIVNGIGTGATYATPVLLHCNPGGDTIEFWAEHPNFDPSQHTFIDNSRETTYGGGGHWPPRQPV